MISVVYVGCPQGERAEMERLLSGADVAVVWADSRERVLSCLANEPMPMIVDLSQGAAALQVAREIRAERPEIPLFAVIDERRPDLTTEAVVAGVVDVFGRPLAPRRVAAVLARQLIAGSPSVEADECDEELYSHSPSMREVMASISRAARSRAGVLICGEEGSGRQITARAIHRAHTEAAFVVVDCATRSADELDVELFGSVGQVDHGDDHGLEWVSCDSRLHQARGGTLYLKNICDAPARVQSRLARLLRDGEAVIRETNATLALDVRPIAAVDPGVEPSREEGRIRQELFKRLSILRIEMPALRNRREDIPALANYFIREICRTHHAALKTLSRPALSLITALPWHGNAVELRATLERVVLNLSGGSTIGLDDVLTHVRLDGASGIFSAGGTLKEARARFEREYIMQMLEQHGGRVSDVARALGIQRTNLYRKMRSLDVARERRPFRR